MVTFLIIMKSKFHVSKVYRINVSLWEAMNYLWDLMNIFEKQ